MSIAGGPTHNGGGTSGGSSGGTTSSSGGGSSSSSSSSNSQSTAKQNAINKYRRVYTSFVFGKSTSSLGVAGLTKAQRKTIKAIINKASQTGLGTNWIQNQIIAKTPNAWLKSATGKARVQTAKDQLESVFGLSQLTKGNTALIALAKKYAKNPNMTSEELDAAIEKTKRFKGEYGDLYKAYVQNTAGASTASLEEKTAAFTDYRKTFRSAMASIPGMSAEQIAAEEALLFSSGVAKDDFTERWSSYQTNKQAYLDLLGSGLTDADRQSILYGTTTEGQTLRTALQNVADINSLYQQYKSSYKSVLGTDLSAEQKRGMLANTASADVYALQRSSSVAETLGQQAGAYQWQTGNAVTQAQKKGLLYAEDSAAGTTSALKRAFSLQQSYKSGSLANFGLSRASDTGTITTTGI